MELRLERQEPEFDIAATKDRAPGTWPVLFVNPSKIAGLTSAKLATASRILAYKGFFNNKIRFRQYPYLRTEDLFGRGE